ncbi:MAG TPA: hypothetical protein VII61_19285 [Ktedonobacteraceae bacterium]
MPKDQICILPGKTLGNKYVWAAARATRASSTSLHCHTGFFHFVALRPYY